MKIRLAGLKFKTVPRDTKAAASNYKALVNAKRVTKHVSKDNAAWGDLRLMVRSLRHQIKTQTTHKTVCRMWMLTRGNKTYVYRNEARTLREAYSDACCEIRSLIQHDRYHQRTCLETSTYLYEQCVGLKIGGVYTSERSFLRFKGRLKLAKVQVDKKPASEARHVGVEIEFCSSQDQEEVASAIVEAGLENHVTLHEDGSITPDADGDCDGSCRDNCECSDPDECDCECTCSKDNGHEICVIATERELPLIMRRVGTMLKDLNAYVNKTCGLHVHLDMRSRSIRQSYESLALAQDLLFRMVPESRQRNTYCQRSCAEYAAQICEHDRYHAINVESYKKHRTIEVRLHSGTVETDKIVNWVKLLVKIADSGSETEVRSLTDLLQVVKLSPKERQYVADRIYKFSGQASRRSAYALAA